MQNLAIEDAFAEASLNVPAATRIETFVSIEKTSKPVSEEHPDCCTYQHQQHS
jgi:hypothetical protein